MALAVVALLTRVAIALVLHSPVVAPAPGITVVLHTGLAVIAGLADLLGRHCVVLLVPPVPDFQVNRSWHRVVAGADGAGRVAALGAVEPGAAALWYERVKVLNTIVSERRAKRVAKRGRGAYLSRRSARTVVAAHAPLSLRSSRRSLLARSHLVLRPAGAPRAAPPG